MIFFPWVLSSVYPKGSSSKETSSLIEGRNGEDEVGGDKMSHLERQEV